MSRDIIATIVTDKVIEKTFTIENSSSNLVAIINDCVHREFGKDFGEKTIDSDECELPILFPDYYSDPQHSLCNGVYPFIVKNKVEWHVPFDEVTVEDFIRTHSIKESDPIKVHVGGGIGGFGDEILPFADWISAIIPFVSPAVNYLASVITIMMAFKGRDGYYIDPRDARDFFRSRKQWEEQEVEEITNMNSGPELDSLMEYSEFRKSDNIFVRQRCSEIKHLDKIAQTNQILWGKYEYDGVIDSVAAKIYDINETLSVIQMLSQELESDSFEIAMEFVERFIRAWLFTIQKGTHFQFLQMVQDGNEVEDNDQFVADLQILYETLDNIRFYLAGRLEKESEQTSCLDK